jgi:hypothetical protein
MITLSEQSIKYSLAEILHSIHEHNRTGLLSILADPNLSIDAHYVWVQNGRVVGVANRLDGMGLLGEISRRKLLSSSEITAAFGQLNQLSQPLGLYLKSLGLLEAGQLRLLFHTQTAKVLKLHEIGDRLFYFDPCILPYNAEMTGMGISAEEIIRLLNLKVLPASNPSLEPPIDRHNTISESAPTRQKSAPISNSFLSSLKGFLTRKGS